MPKRELPSLTKVDRRAELTEDEKKAVFAKVAWDAANDLFLDEPPNVDIVEIYDFSHPRRNFLVHRPVTENGPIIVTQTPSSLDETDSERMIYQDHLEWTIYSRKRSRVFAEPLSLAGHYLLTSKMVNARRASDVQRELEQLPEELRRVLGDHPFAI